MLEMKYCRKYSKIKLKRYRSKLISYKRLMTECKLTQDVNVDERVGKRETSSVKFLRLLKLPEEIQSTENESNINGTLDF